MPATSPAWDEHAIVRIDQVIGPAARGADDRKTAGQRLDDDDTKGLVVAGEREGVGRFHLRAHAVRGQGAREVDLFRNSELARKPLRGSPATGRRRPAATACQSCRERLQQMRRAAARDPFRATFGRRKETQTGDLPRHRQRRNRATKPFAPKTFAEKRFAEDIGQIAPLRSRVVALEQTRKVGTDGDAPARPPGDPADQVALPPPPSGGTGAMLGDNKRDPKAPIDRQRQHPGIQAAMRVNQIRRPVLGDVTAEQFHAASGPCQRITIRQPRQCRKVVAPINRHAVNFDSRVPEPSARHAAGSQIAPGVNSGSEYRDAMTRRL